jgi:hypothetical protein
LHERWAAAAAVYSFLRSSVSHSSFDRRCALKKRDDDDARERGERERDRDREGERERGGKREREGGREREASSL